jgi:MFS family permease
MRFADKSRQVLAYADCRRYLSARFLIMVGAMMVSVVIGWQIWDITHSTLYLGYAGLSEFIPNLVFALPAGQFADRHDRRYILLCCIAIFAVCSAALLAIALSPHPSVILIFIISAITGLARAFLAPATQSLLPLLVPKDIFPSAVALSATSMKVATILGPILGGLLNALGTQTVYAVSTSLFVAAFITTLGYKTTLKTQNQTETGIKGLLSGIHYVWSKPVIFASISLDLFAVLLGGATALLPVYASDILHVDSTGLGLLRAAPGVGSALMAIALSLWPLERTIGPKLLIAVAIYGLATVIFGVSQSFLLSIGALLVLGAADMISVVIRQTLVQINTPNAMRGRVSAINWVFIGASNELGEFESGLTATWFGTVPAVIIGGVGSIIVAATWFILFPPLRQADRLTHDDAEEIETNRA